MNLWLFVVPDRFGHPSGGTRYNAALIGEVEARGVTVNVAEPTALERADFGELPPSEWVWIDSLYLDSLPRLAARARALAGGRVRVGLLLHYLPSLLEIGDVNLWRQEQDALAACDALVVTSEYMRAELCKLGLESKPCAVVEPGCELEMEREPPDTTALRALMVAHVVSNKGAYEFLQALASKLSSPPDWTLDIAGSLDIELAYARRCRDLVECTPTLKRCVNFHGVVRGEALRELFARSNVFVSASRTESYGMALAEARTMGLPVLAMSGGNVSAHVSARSGGRLCADPSELAAACIELASNAEARMAELALARRAAPPARPWSRVAEEFVVRVRALTPL